MVAFLLSILNLGSNFATKVCYEKLVFRKLKLFIIKYLLNLLSFPSAVTTFQSPVSGLFLIIDIYSFANCFDAGFSGGIEA